MYAYRLILASSLLVLLAGCGPEPKKIVLDPGKCYMDSKVVLLQAAEDADSIVAYLRTVPAVQRTAKPNDPPFTTVTAGWGARHVAFHANGKIAYLLTEMGSRLTTFSYDAAHENPVRIRLAQAGPGQRRGQRHATAVQHRLPGRPRTHRARGAGA